MRLSYVLVTLLLLPLRRKLLGKRLAWVLRNDWSKEGLVRAGWVLAQKVFTPSREVFVAANLSILVRVKDLKNKLKKLKPFTTRSWTRLKINYFLRKRPFTNSNKKSINDWLKTDLEHSFCLSASYPPSFLQIAVLSQWDETSSFNLNSFEEGPAKLVDGVPEFAIYHWAQVVDELLLRNFSKVGAWKFTIFEEKCLRQLHTSAKIMLTIGRYAVGVKTNLGSGGRVIIMLGAENLW